MKQSIQSRNISPYVLGAFAYFGANQFIRFLLNFLELYVYNFVSRDAANSLSFPIFLIAPALSVLVAWTLQKENHYRLGIFVGLGINFLLGFYQFGQSIG